MRLKEIKPGMVIHCKTHEEKKALLEEAERLCYRWNSTANLPTSKAIYSGSTIHFYEKDEFTDFKNITWSENTEGVTEFSDLIMPELTAEEVLKIVDDICETKSYNENNCSPNCPFCHGIFCRQWMAEHPTETVEICAKWKALAKENEHDGE